MGKTRIDARRLGVALAAALGLAAMAPSTALAVRCDSPGKDGRINGADKSRWFPSAVDMSDAEIKDPDTGDRRGDAYDGYVRLRVDGQDYQNPDENDCTLRAGGQELVYPTDKSNGSLKINRRLFVSPKHPFVRFFDSITNTGAGTVQVDVEWTGNLGSDSSTEVGTTSSGDASVDAGDTWATTCEDNENDGCADEANPGDPDLSHNWERDGDNKALSADDVTLSGDQLTVDFDNVAIKPGQTVSFLHVSSLALSIDKANKNAERIGGDPGSFGVFDGLSDQERKRTLNWFD